MAGYLDAVVRFFNRTTGGTIDLSMTEWEALRVTQHEAEGQEETRAGLRFTLAPKNGVTGIAPVQALPTTAAQWVLWNKDLYKSAIVEELGMFLASGTAGAGIEVVGTLFQTPSQDAVALNASMGIWNNNGNGGGGSAASSSIVCVSGVTLTQPAAPFWYPFAEGLSAATAVASVPIINRFVHGRLIIPPKTGLALAVLSPAGSTPLYAPVAQWVEKVISNQG